MDRTNGIYIPHTCPRCGSPATQINIKTDTSNGFEVESLTTRDYYGPIVDTLLQVLPFEYILERLCDECTANAWDAASRILSQITEDNESYQALLKEFDRLEEIKDRWERHVKDALSEIAGDHVEDWRDDDEDPDSSDFRRWVEDATDYTGPWRPFSQSDRTTRLVEWLQEEAADLIDGLTIEEIEW